MEPESKHSWLLRRSHTPANMLIFNRYGFFRTLMFTWWFLLFFDGGQNLKEIHDCPLSWSNWNGYISVIQTPVETDEQIVNSLGVGPRLLSSKTAKSLTLSSVPILWKLRPVSSAGNAKEVMQRWQRATSIVAGLIKVIAETKYLIIQLLAKSAGCSSSGDEKGMLIIHAARWNTKSLLQFLKYRCGPYRYFQFSSWVTCDHTKLMS